MARSLRDIRRKIKAVKSTRQVTKAMELVAASKMRRATQNANNLRQYALTAWRILQEIAEVPGDIHPYLKERSISKVLVVLMTSDRGLCGSLNAHVTRAAERYLESVARIKEGKVDFVAVGRKGQHFLRRMGVSTVAAFPAFSNHPKFRDILPLTRLTIEGFANGTYDHIVLIYPEFISPLVQEVDVKVLLPFSAETLAELAADLVVKKRSAKETKKLNVREFKFEPSPREVLDIILPQLTEVQMYQAVLEAAASEHSARMVAMRNASENASDILGDLTLTYNQTRQAGITAELAELSGAAAALSSN